MIYSLSILDVEPSFISAVTPQRRRLEGGSLSLPHCSDPACQPANEERLTSSYTELSHRVAVEQPRIFLEDHAPPDEGHTSNRSQESARQDEIREPSRSKQKAVDIPPPPVDQVDSFSGSQRDLSSKSNFTHHPSHSLETGAGPELVVHIGSRKKRTKKKKRRKGEAARLKVTSEWQNGEAGLRADDGQDEEAELNAASGQQQEENAQMGTEEGLSDVPTPVGSMPEVTESIDRLSASGMDETCIALQHSSLVSQMRPPFAASDWDPVPDRTSEATTGPTVQLRADLTDDQLDIAASTEGYGPPHSQEEGTEWMAGAIRIQQDRREAEEDSNSRWPGLTACSPEARAGLPCTG